MVMESILAAFRDNGLTGLLTFGISLVALLVSGLAWWSSHKTSNRLVEIEEWRDEAAKRQASKARLQASLEPVPRNNSWELAIKNHGEADAHNVIVTCDGQPLDRLKCLKQDRTLKDYIPAGCTAKYVLLTAMGSPLPQSVHIVWDDTSGERGHLMSDL